MRNVQFWQQPAGTRCRDPQLINAILEGNLQAVRELLAAPGPVREGRIAHHLDKNPYIGPHVDDPASLAILCANSNPNGMSIVLALSENPQQLQQRIEKSGQRFPNIDAMKQIAAERRDMELSNCITLFESTSRQRGQDWSQMLPSHRAEKTSSN